MNKIKGFFVVMTLILLFVIIGFVVNAQVRGRDVRSHNKGKDKFEGILNAPTLVGLEQRGIIKKELIDKIKENPDEKQRVIVVFSKKPKNYRGGIKDIGGKIIYDYKIIEGVAVELPNSAIERLGRLQGVSNIQEEEILYPVLDDSISLINADDVHNPPYNYDGSGVRVCVLDTGIDKDHVAFPSGTIVGEYDFINNDTDASDDDGHGSSVAGIIASRDLDYTGVAPGTSLLVGKVCDGGCPSADVISGIEWCMNNDADVISMSLGGGSSN